MRRLRLFRTATILFMPRAHARWNQRFFVFFKCTKHQYFIFLFHVHGFSQSGKGKNMGGCAIHQHKCNLSCSMTSKDKFYRSVAPFLWCKLDPFFCCFGRWNWFTLFFCWKYVISTHYSNLALWKILGKPFDQCSCYLLFTHVYTYPLKCFPYCALSHMAQRRDSPVNGTMHTQSRIDIVIVKKHWKALVRRDKRLRIGLIAPRYSVSGKTDQCPDQGPNVHS